MDKRLVKRVTDPHFGGLHSKYSYQVINPDGTPGAIFAARSDAMRESLKLLWASRRQHRTDCDGSNCDRSCPTENQ